MVFLVGRVLNRERNFWIMAGNLGGSAPAGSLCSPFGRRGNDWSTRVESLSQPSPSEKRGWDRRWVQGEAKRKFTPMSCRRGPVLIAQGSTPGFAFYGRERVLQQASPWLGSTARE